MPKLDAHPQPKEEPFTAEQKEVIKKDIKEFLNNMFGAMSMEVKADITFDDEENSVNVDLSGDNMGVLIGKRGQTLDSIQYLTSLVINKNSEKYVRVKLDTENYRKRRKETLESLAKNIAYKVKRSRRPVSLMKEELSIQHFRQISLFLQEVRVKNLSDMLLFILKERIITDITDN